MNILPLSAALLALGTPAHGEIQTPSPVSIPVVLSFEPGESSLTPERRRQLDDAVAAYRRGEPVRLMIAGPNSRGAHPSSSCCIGVSQRRSDHVRHYLEAAGVQGQDIVTEAFGSDQARRDHARILITFGPGSGW